VSGSDIKALVEAMFTIEPPPLSFIIFAASLEHRNTDLRFVFITSSQSSFERVYGDSHFVIPALFIRMSTVPHSFTVFMNK
jgi:hypothetical protein